jgi:Icc-related predicted phosphoesterase
MKICAISDTHNKHKQVEIPEADMIIHAGDFSGHGHSKEVKDFLKWFSSLPIKYKIYIAGNHDMSYMKPEFKNKMIEKYKDLIYLEDSSVEIEGIKIYGSPWQPEFLNWAFNLPREGQELFDAWEKIPDDTDILITHGPPHDVLDHTDCFHPKYSQDTGCRFLRQRIEKIGKIKYCIFGHIHERKGINQYALRPAVCMNVSICNLSYIPINLPTVFNY